MPTFLREYATVFLIVGLVLALLALRNAIYYFNQSRRAPYYILREEAARSAQRWVILAALVFAVIVGLVVWTAQAGPTPGVEPTATAATAVPTLGPPPTHTPTPAPSPTARAPSPTATATPPPTATFAPDVPAALLTPIPDAAAPNPAAKFEFLTLASRLDPQSNPLDPGLQFLGGASRVHVFFRATGVNDGAPWGIFCYRDRQLVDQFVGLWDDGPASQVSRAFCAVDGSQGAYRLRAYLGTTPAFEVQFLLTGAPAAPAATP